MLISGNAQINTAVQPAEDLTEPFTFHIALKLFLKQSDQNLQVHIAAAGRWIIEEDGHQEEAVSFISIRCWISSFTFSINVLLYTRAKLGMHDTVTFQLCLRISLKPSDPVTSTLTSAYDCHDLSRFQ